MGSGTVIDMKGNCLSCKFACICGDDKYIKCIARVFDGRFTTYVSGCEKYEKRNDGLILKQVWDWREE